MASGIDGINWQKSSAVQAPFLPSDGLRIPQDIAVNGFDNIPAAELVSPALTTVTQFQEQLGRRAAQMLLERFDGSAPAVGRCEEMPADLIIRESA